MNNENLIGATANNNDSDSIGNNYNDQATKADINWRNKIKSGADDATKADINWRKAASSGTDQPTQADINWRGRVSSLAASSGEIAPNHFRTIEEFKNAVSALTSLTSIEGKVYSVKETLSDKGGESLILLCSAPDEKKVVAKIYYQSVNSGESFLDNHQRVLRYTATEEGKKYCVPIEEAGFVEFGNSKYYFEIMPYYPEGDVSDDVAYSFEEIVEITRQLNEALHSIHKTGIIHRDIKPHNIYKDGTRFLLGDFGIAKIVENVKNNATKTIAGSDGYIAPELLMGLSDNPTFIYSNKIDYYSLGITLAVLFEGKFIYEKMEDEMILRSIHKGQPPLSRVDPHRAEFENLLYGLCRFDPTQRFGYEEVKNWLEDHNYTGTYASPMSNGWPRPIDFLDESYTDEKSLFFAITKDSASWEEGKNFLYKKYFEDFFRSFSTGIASAARKADEAYRTANQDKGLAVFLKRLYAPGPIVWRGYTFTSLSQLGEKMVEAKSPLSYSEILSNNCISHWLSKTKGISVDDKTIKLVDEIEALSATEPEIACFWFGNAFAPERKLHICGKTVSTISELTNTLFESPVNFYQGGGYEKLSSRYNGSDLYGFLFSFGYKTLIDEEWKNIGKCDEFNKAVLFISMMDDIAVKDGTDPSIIRSFFVKYGPVGIAAYTHKIASDANKPAYRALDSAGKRLLSEITAFKAPASGSVEELFRAYTPLLEKIDRMRRILVENPHCILAGLYDSSGIICTNLKGCFAFKIFDRLAPLGFNALLENSNGGM